ncbi:Protein of unknown function [Gryllus bimaculatus]|nr:Protein of unknown function [Gryllus bimaculatus]
MRVVFIFLPLLLLLLFFFFFFFFFFLQKPLSHNSTVNVLDSSARAFASFPNKRENLCAISCVWPFLHAQTPCNTLCVFAFHVMYVCGVVVEMLNLSFGAQSRNMCYLNLGVLKN